MYDPCEGCAGWADGQCRDCIVAILVMGELEPCDKCRVRERCAIAFDAALMPCPYFQKEV